MTVTYLPDHVEQALSRLATQYVSQPNVTGLVTALAYRAQVIEDALLKVSSQRLLYGGASVGAQLDVIGDLVGLRRNNLDDATYYVLILGQIAKNYSDGSMATILRITKTIFQASDVWVTSPNTFGHQRRPINAELSLAVSDPQTPLTLVPLLVQILQASLAGGITLVSITRFESDGAVAPDGDQPWVTGLGDVYRQGGGKLATILYQNPNA